MPLAYADKNISIDLLSQKYSYDPDTGNFYHRVRTGTKMRAGAVAGTSMKDGRRNLYFQGKLLRASRVAWAISTGAWPVGVIDHINQDPSDNRLANLRDISPTENLWNTDKSHALSGVRGVHYLAHRNTWYATCVRNGVRYSFGTHHSADAAASALKEGKIRMGIP